MNVSRETLSDLEAFVSDLIKWNTKINLVAPGTEKQIWDRHIQDSAQLAHIVDWPKIWLDIGSGGGLPGLVLAIIAKTDAPETQFHFVESDQRKCAFLRYVSVNLGLNTTIHAARIENATEPKAGVISARALAPLDQLIGYSKPFLGNDTVCLFPKGVTYTSEIEQAQNKWTFDYDVIKSKTNSDSAIVVVRNIT